MRHTLTSTTCSGTIRRINKDYIQIDSCGFWLTATMHDLIWQKFDGVLVGREIDVTYNVETGYVTSVEEQSE